MNKQKMLSLLNVLVVVLFTLAMPAFAAGLEKANESAELVIDILNGVSIAVGTIAFMILGYKYMYTDLDKKEAFRIIIGALIFGGAPQLAVFFMS